MVVTATTIWNGSCLMDQCLLRLMVIRLRIMMNGWRQLRMTICPMIGCCRRRRRRMFPLSTITDAGFRTIVHQV